MVLKGDQYYTDPANEIGSISADNYTAGNSIGTVTVRLRDNAGTIKEAVITVIPPAPTGITVVPAGANTLKITWLFIYFDQITNFKIFRSSGGAAYVEISTQANNKREYLNSGLSAATEYTYYLQTVAGTFLSLSTIPTTATTD